MRKLFAFAPTLVVCLVGLAAASGCHKDEAPAVGRLEVQPRSFSFPYPELVTLHLTWTPVSSLGEGAQPVVFVHLLDGKAAVVRTFDHPFPQAWTEGTPVSYDLKIYQSAVGDALPAGRYRLSIGLYAKGGKRWNLDGVGQPIGRHEYLAAAVDVPASSDAPRFTFSPNWLPIEAGTDHQVMARRWLSEEAGTLRLDDVRGPGILWLMVRIPKVIDPNDKLVLNSGGANAPAVLVRSNCGGETEVSGIDTHSIDLPINGPGEGGGCRITFIPNFRLVSTATPQQRSISLEIAAWVPGKTAAAPAAAQPPAASGNAAAAPTPAPPAGSGAKP